MVADPEKLARYCSVSGRPTPTSARASPRQRPVGRPRRRDEPLLGLKCPYGFPTVPTSVRPTCSLDPGSAPFALTPNGARPRRARPRRLVRRRRMAASSAVRRPMDRTPGSLRLGPICPCSVRVALRSIPPDRQTAGLSSSALGTIAIERRANCEPRPLGRVIACAPSRSPVVVARVTVASANKASWARVRAVL